MKKIILALGLLVATAFSASAQMFKADLSVLVSNASLKNGIDGISKEIKTSPYVNVRAYFGADIPLPMGFYVNPGIAYRAIGYKSKDGQKSGMKNREFKTTSHEVQIPVHVGYKLGISDLISIAFQAGPYFTYDFKTKSFITADKNEMNSDVDNKHIRKYDLGIGAAAYLTVMRYYLTIGTDYGFVNKYKDLGNKNKWKNTSFYVGLGLRF